MKNFSMKTSVAILISLLVAAGATGSLAGDLPSVKPDGIYTEVVSNVVWTFAVVKGKAFVGGGSSSATAVDKATSGAVAIPLTLGGCDVVGIGEDAFHSCSSLTEVFIPTSITSMARAAFCNSGIQSIKIPSSISSVSEDAFFYCWRLASVEIENGVREIGPGAFYSCSRLKTIKIPQSVENIGNDAFGNCTGLGNGVVMVDGCVLCVNGTCPEHVELAQGTRLIAGGAFYDCGTLGSISIPESVTSIGAFAFWGCISLESIVVPNMVDIIREQTFRECTNLSSIVISSNVTAIGQWAFLNCSRLATVAIPDKVECIGESAFSGCEKLMSVYFAGDAPEKIGSYMYSGTPDELCTFVKARTTGWKKYGAIGLPKMWPGNDYGARRIAYDPNEVTPEHLVRFDLGEFAVRSGGGALEQKVRDCESAVEPLVDSAEGWIFKGWSERFNCVTNDMIIRAYTVPCASSPVTTESLADGKEMQEYSAVLQAEVGGSCSWSALQDDYSQKSVARSFCVAGHSYGWSGTYSSWEYELPFDFEFYGRRFSSVFVNDNGTLTFNGEFTDVTANINSFTNLLAIAPLYTWFNSNDAYGSDVYVYEDDDSVVFTWKRYSVYLSAGIGFSATLFKDGRIRFAYEKGVDLRNQSYPQYISGISAGDGTRICFVNRSSSDASDVEFQPTYRESEGDLPPGLSLSEDGALHGIPTQAGNYVVKIGLTDDKGDLTVCNYPFFVVPNANQRPIIVGMVPTADSFNISIVTNQSSRFTVVAEDPEGAELTYRWYWDGELKATEHDGLFTYVAETDAIGYHTLTCDISDGLWIGEVKCSWAITVLGATRVTPETDFEALAMSLRYSDCLVFAPGEYDMSMLGDLFMFGSGCMMISEQGPTKTILKGECDYMHGYSFFRGFKFVDTGSIMGGQFENCVFTECNDLFLEDCVLRNCHLYGNHGLSLRFSQIQNSTIASNEISEYGFAEICTFVNSIVWEDTLVSYADSEYLDTTFDYCCLSFSVMDGVGNVFEDPKLADSLGGDCRLRSGSPCLDVGTYDVELVAKDIYGAERIQGERPDIGATEGSISGFIAVARVKGHGKVKNAVQNVSEGGSVTFEAEDGVRPFDHFEMDGDIVSREPTFSILDVHADCEVTAVFSEYSFFVDAESGTDAHDGLSRISAVATIQRAVDLAVDGEVITVMPGRYSPIDTANKRIAIIGEGGASRTFIDAIGASNRCATLSTTWQGTNTFLKGFTLCNGLSYASRGFVYAGGVYGGTLENCVISNCQVQSESSWNCRGGGTAYGVLKNCLVVDNHAVSPYNYSEGGGCYESTVVGCTIVGNSAASGGGAYYGDLYNTIVWDNSANGSYSNVAYSSTFSCSKGNPKFINPLGSDYRLSEGSPCINAGNNAYVTSVVDLDGNNRISGAAVDIGAYEYQQTVLMPLDVDIPDVVKSYDGIPTSVVVRVDSSVEDAVIVRYSVDCRTWTADAPLFVNATNAFVWVAASASGYSSVTNRAQIAIIPRVVIVTAGSKQKTYDGMPLTSHEFSTFGFVTGEGIASAVMTPESAIVEVGEVANVIANVVPVPGTLLSNYEIRFETGSLKVSPATMPSLDNVEETKPFDPLCPRPPVPPMSPSGELLMLSDYDFVGTYDGQGHTLDAFALLCEIMDQPLLFATNFEISYSVDGHTWQSDPFVYTNVVETSFWYRVSAPNMTSGIHTVGVTVLPRPATVTAGSASKTYDGTPLVSSDFIATGFVDGEGVLSVTMTTASTITEVGSIDNEIESVVFKPSCLESNYQIAYQPGTLEVTEAIPLPIGEAVNAADYDWMTGGDVPWIGEKNSTAADGVHHAVVRGLGNSASSFVQTTVFGSGVVAFTWSNITSSKNTKVQFLVDDEVVGMLMGKADRTGAEFQITGEGEHVLKWRVSTGRSGATDEDMVTLDQVVWKPDHEPNLGEALNSDLEWTTFGDETWEARGGISGAVGSCAVVTGLGDLQTASLKTKVYGEGVLSFSWAVSCEEEYDWMELTVDGEVYSYVTGQEDWRQMVVPVTGKRWHTISWEYVKDEKDEPELAGWNRAMVDEVVWLSNDISPDIPNKNETENTPVPVPYSIFENSSFKVYLDAANGDYETAAMAIGKNGCPVWESFVAGLDPENPDSQLMVKIKIVNGKPVVTWDPALNGTNEDGTCIKEGVRAYQLKGSTDLKNWSIVPDKGERMFKFFKVEVKMP